jgi:hypothetical protein
VKHGLARLDPLAVVCCVDDVVRSVEELLNRLTKEARVAPIDGEFDRDGATDLDTLSQYVSCT